MKGIILAGGSGTRLYPLTKAISKQLLPVYDKPMVYYPLSVLMLAEIRDILIISTPTDINLYKKLLGSGKQWGLNLQYAEQASPDGIAQAFIIAESFIGNDSCSLILGDNIFYGHDFTKLITNFTDESTGATIFAYPVKDPERYGVIEFDNNGQAVDIIEKPSDPKSKYAITGLYFYDNNVIDIAKSIVPSSRGELEITDINKHYLRKGELSVVTLGRGIAWLDTGTPSSILEASCYMETIEKRQGLKVYCPEEIAYRLKYISAEQLEKLSDEIPDKSYSNYLKEILNENINK